VPDARYEQGMARPEIDIGAGSRERKPVAERTTLLTGGAGFIGGHLARALLDTGRRVIVLDVRAYTPEARFAIGSGIDEIPFEVASIGDQAQSNAAGYQVHLSKPVVLSELTSHIARLVEEEK